MSIILIIYALAPLVIIALFATVYRLLRQRGPFITTVAAVLLLTGLTLLWPIPIHGGFTFLGDVLYREFRNARRQQQHDAAQQQTAEFIRQAENRTAGPLSFTVTQSLSDGWSRVQTADKMAAWHHRASGLLWSNWLSLPASTALPSLKDARNRCRRYPPAGYWALATETENYYLWKTGGEQHLPPAPTSSIAQRLDPGSRLEMATYHLKNTARNDQSGSELRRYVVRCTARSANAPTRGYLRQDIPVAEWNRYQMRRL